MNISEQLQSTLKTMRHSLAKMRASRKAETDAHLWEAASKSYYDTEGADSLLEHDFHAYSVLERLRFLELARSSSQLPDDALLDAERHLQAPAADKPDARQPSAEEIAAFLKALHS